jgi:hypothetical protein
MMGPQRFGFNLAILLEDEPGQLAALGEALGTSQVNIEGICGVPSEGHSLVHILVHDPEAARSVLEGAGFEIQSERKVLLVDIIDRPGELGGVARRLADANLNIDLLYLTASMDLVIGVEPIDEAANILTNQETGQRRFR